MKETKECYEVRYPNGEKVGMGYIAKADKALETINGVFKRLDHLGVIKHKPQYALIKVSTTKETDNRGNFQKETQISTFDRYITFDKSKNKYIME